MLVKKTASCVDMLEWFEQNHQIVPEPNPGDIVFFKYPTNNRRTNHVGLVCTVKSADNFQTTEGNTSINSNDNGGSVMLRNRTKKNVVAFARPRYSSPDQKKKLLSIANGELGVKECPPNSNNVKYNTWFYKRQVSGKDYPWCAVFISYIFDNLENGTVLRRGSKGEEVKKLQILLSKCGYVLEIDGEYGPITESYVRHFQQTKGLKVDGVVGPITWSELMGGI